LWNWLQELEYYAPSIVYQPGILQPADALSRIESNAIEVSPAYSSSWPEIVAKYLFNDPNWSTGVSVKMQKLVRLQSKNFKFLNNILHRKVLSNGDTFWVPYLGGEERKNEVMKYHSVLGHLAANSVYEVIKMRHWWPRQEEEIKRILLECQMCQLTERRVKPAVAPLHSLPPAPLPFQRWHLDFLQDLPSTLQGYDNIITATDSATRWFVAKATKGRTAKVVAKFLFEEIMVNYGCPVEIVSDRASAFMADVLAEYLEILKTRHLPTSPYHPR
jgi:hypothetical protein